MVLIDITIYVKQTRNERVSDTVFFKTKFITQPTLTPADTIPKALNNSRQALKGKNNQQGIDQIEALTKFNDILNNTPERTPTQEEPTFPTETRRVTFDDMTKPPQVEEQIINNSILRVMKPMERKHSTPMHKVTIDKIIPNAQIPRVKITKSKPANNDTRERIRKYIASKTMARIPQRHTHLHRTTRSNERAQLIHDKKKEHVSQLLATSEASKVQCNMVHIFGQ
jgi:hypothetical protein